MNSSSDTAPKRAISPAAESVPQGVRLGIAPGDDLEYPSGSLVVVGGCVGAGKSTLVNRLASNPDLHVLSLDEMRRDVQEARGGDRESYDRRCWPEANGRFIKELHDALREGKTILVDLVACVEHARMDLGFTADLYGRQLHMIMIDATYEECVQAQATRAAPISPEIVSRYYGDWTEMKGDMDKDAETMLRMNKIESITVIDRAAARAIQGIRVTSQTIPRSSAPRTAHEHVMAWLGTPRL